MRFCNKCGSAVKEGESFCSACGAVCAVEDPGNFCGNCGAKMSSDDNFCRKCGADKNGNPRVHQAQPAGRRSKLVAGLLGIFVGGLGIHNFYLGKTGLGVIQIVVSVVTCGLGYIWGFVEGILILCDRICYDGDGNPLGE